MAGYALSDAQREHAALLREQRALRLELATRKSSNQTEREARERLGMVKPSADRIFLVPAAPEAQGDDVGSER